jgi:hypothetical protein
MPFKSQRQIQTCFSKQLLAESKNKKWSWNCEEWLSKTPNPLCLPSLVGHRVKTCRALRVDEKIISPVYEGQRGGYYFFAKGVKVYIPKAAINYAKQKLGVT